MKDDYIRKIASIERVIDGDTFIAQVSLGFNVYVRAHIRTAGFSAAELTEPEGNYLKACATTLLTHPVDTLWCRSLVVEHTDEPKMTFQRWLAYVYVGDADFAVMMNQMLKKFRRTNQK